MKSRDKRNPRRAAGSDESRLRARVGNVARALEGVYGRPCVNRSADAVGAFVRTVLSQNTNDLLSDRAYASLRRRFPSWADVARADTEEIEAAIRIGGLARQKSRRLKHILGSLPNARGRPSLAFLRRLGTDEALGFLTSFVGVGPKTARVVLLFAFGREVFPVDTHILRVSKRLGILPVKVTLERAHELWAPLVPRGKSCSLHLNLIRLGRQVCRPGTPLCGLCCLERLCPKVGVVVRGQG